MGPQSVPPTTMEVADIAIKPVKEFAKDSYRLVRKCTKPDRKEFSKIARRTGLGFIVMGFVWFFVKLILYVALFFGINHRNSPPSRTTPESIRTSGNARVEVFLFPGPHDWNARRRECS